MNEPQQEPPIKPEDWSVLKLFIPVTKARRVWQLLKEIENHCPCGARPESLNTHPHVSGCPVEAALVLLTPATPPADAPTDATAQITAVLDEARADGEGTTDSVAIGSKSVDATSWAGLKPCKHRSDGFCMNCLVELNEIMMASENRSDEVITTLERTIATLRDECARLREWKESAMKAMPDYQELGQLLEMPLGASVNEKLIPAIKLLKADKERLDWLEKHPFMAYRDRDPASGDMCDHFTLVDEDKGRKHGRTGIVQLTLRDCIDAASRAGTEGK